MKELIKKMKSMTEMINEAEFAESIQQLNAAVAIPQDRDLFVGNDGVAIVRNVLKKCSTSSSPPANVVAVMSLIQTCALNGNLIVIVSVIVIDVLLKIHSSIFPCVFDVCWLCGDE